MGAPTFLIVRSAPISSNALFYNGRKQGIPVLVISENVAERLKQPFLFGKFILFHSF